MAATAHRLAPVSLYRLAGCHEHKGEFASHFNPEKGRYRRLWSACMANYAAATIQAGTRQKTGETRRFINKNRLTAYSPSDV